MVWGVFGLEKEIDLCRNCSKIGKRDFELLGVSEFRGVGLVESGREGFLEIEGGWVVFE